MIRTRPGANIPQDKILTQLDRKSKGYKRPVDKLKLCPECGRVWELVGSIEIYYKDFPRYGRKKKKCDGCR